MVKVCGIKDGLFGLGDTVRGGKVTDRCEVQSEPKSAVLTKIGRASCRERV